MPAQWSSKAARWSSSRQATAGKRRSRLGYDALEGWCGGCAVPVSGGPVDAGHYLAEDAPGETIARLSAYFSA